jgi:hypothetical protein
MYNCHNYLSFHHFSFLFLTKMELVLAVLRRGAVRAVRACSPLIRIFEELMTLSQINFQQIR